MHEHVLLGFFAVEIPLSSTIADGLFVPATTANENNESLHVKSTRMRTPTLQSGVQYNIILVLSIYILYMFLATCGSYGFTVTCS